ncbi:MAG: hypothetical protein LKK00_00065 [Intestinimonas sp.]|jgi:hypothetical protein|nr:hypothetical protein [Intestinimonas sp.]
MGSANKTANYGLNQWQPNEYPKMEDFNRDNAAIDAALTAARSAEEYNPAGTYAVGDYCTHGGKLYRCTTAIPAAEAWTAGHWTETMVAGELLAMIATLAGKADNVTSTILSWDDLMAAKSGVYLVSSTVTGMPATGAWWHVWLLTDSGSQNKTIIARKVSAENGLWTLCMVNGALGEWSGPYATATPPTEYDLPLASGFTNVEPSKYSKDQFGRCLVDFIISGTIAADTIVVVGTLPSGYRPAKTMHTVGYSYADGGATMELWITANGEITVYSPSAISSAAGQVSFVAGN